MARMMIVAEKCGSSTSSAEMTASIAANGAMPYRKVRIRSLYLHISAEK